MPLKINSKRVYLRSNSLGIGVIHHMILIGSKFFSVLPWSISIIFSLLFVLFAMSRRRFLYLPMEGRRNRVAQRFAFPSSDKRRPLGFTSVRVSRGCLRRYFAIVCMHECREDVSFWSTLAFDDAKKERERKSERGRAGDGRIGGVLYAMPNMYALIKRGMGVRVAAKEILSRRRVNVRRACFHERRRFTS